MSGPFRRGTWAAVAAVLVASGGLPAGAQSTSIGDVATELRDALQPVDEVLESLPDRGALLASKLDRGELVRELAEERTPSSKVVDGDPSDWTGRSALVAGSWHLDAGELLYTNFLFDAFGADDGGDRQRLDDFAELFYVVMRTERIDDLLRTSGSQLGVPEPLGASDNYGDQNTDLAVGDLVEVRLAADDDRAYLLTTFSNWTEENRDRLGVLVLADTGNGLGDCRGESSFVSCDGDGAVWRPGGTPLRTERFDVGVLLRPDGVAGAAAIGEGGPADLGAGDFEVASDASGWTNVLEASLPAGLMAPGGVLDVAVISGVFDDDGGFTPVNIAFRPQEPIDIHNDRLQAFALLDAAESPSIDQFSSGPVELEDLRRGASESVRPGPGYHEVLFRSGENISREQGQDGTWQHYGLFVPSSFEPGRPTPATFWLHYRGGKAHSAAAINPRLVRQLGEERGNLVVSPRGRGTSTWYVSQAHQDVWEVFEDVHERFPEIDPRRRYLSGYSMGGYGTYLFGLLYPDVWAAGFVQSGAMTQGAWLGGGPDDEPDPFFGEGWIEANEGNADAQLAYRVLENARHFPVAIDHGTFDQLVPITGVERMALRLLELGYRHQYTRFIGYEHFTQAIVEEWADGAAYLDRFALPESPRRVTYKVVPALVRALNSVRADGVEFSFNPDGVWWVSGIVPRDADPRDPSSFALVDATSHAITEEPTLPLPLVGVLSPLDHSTPYLRTGLDLVGNPLAEAPPLRDHFEIDLTNVAEVSLDLDGMRLGPQSERTVTGSVTTDGLVTLNLTWSSGSEAFDLPAGSHRVSTVVSSQDSSPDEADGVLAAEGSGGGETPPSSNGREALQQARRDVSLPATGGAPGTGGAQSALVAWLMASLLIGVHAGRRVLGSDSGGRSRARGR